VLASNVGAAAINESKLHISNSPTNGYFLSAQSGNAGGLTWAQVNTDLSNDSSPQLGGDLDSNGNDILLGDNDEIKLGAGGDLKLEHQSSSGHSYITEVGTGNLYIQASNLILRDAGTLEHYVDGTQNGAVNLYYDGSKRFETVAAGAKVKRYGGGATTLFVEGPEGANAILDMFADDGDDNADKFRLTATTGGTFYMQNYANNGWQTNISYTGAGNVELFHNGSKKFETTSSGVSLGAITHTLLWPAFVGTSASRSWGFIGEDGTYGKFELKYSNGNDLTLDEVALRAYANGEVQLLYDNSLKFRTLSTGAQIYSGDLRFINSSWEGEVAGKITQHSNYLYFQGGSNGFQFRSSGGTDRLVLDSNGHLRPAATNTYDLGTSSHRWRNVYTNDLNLSNEGGTNDVDGTWGDWTVQEGESDLFLKNNRSGKKYKFNLTEVS